MFKNYLLTTLRNTLRRKGISVLNVLGLSIGIAASLLILQYVKDEKSYDDFHTNAENIYRVQYDFYRNNEQVFQCASAFPKVAPAMMADFPEVENACRLYLRYGGGVVRYNDISINENDVYTVDQSFFEVFSYPLVKGDRHTVLKEANTAVVEEQTARKYFGDADPVGKRIRFENDEEYEITGVVRSPENSHLKFTFLFSYSTLVTLWGPSFNDAWGWYDFFNYVQLKPGTDPRALEAKFPAFIKKYGGEDADKRIRFSLQHLPDIHLYSHLIQEARMNGDGRAVHFLMIIAFFILVIAWVNYINLATARAVERAKEVGVRKSIGAARGQIMVQFLAEAFLINFVSLVVAVVLLLLAIPFFNLLAGKHLTASILGDPGFWYATSAFFFIGCVFSGIYPAFVLSAYQPVKVLKGRVSGSREGLALRKVLVVVQFVFSVGLIAGTMIVYKQLYFMQHRELGIDIDRMLVVHAPHIRPDPRGYAGQFSSFKKELLQHASVKKVTGSSEVPGNLIYWTNGSARVEEEFTNDNTIMYRIGVDTDFFGTYGNKLVAGRLFGEEFTGDSSSVVLNREAVRRLGFKDAEEAVNRQIRIGRDTLTVVGVVENYHQEGLKTEFRQTAFTLNTENHLYYSLKMEGPHPGQTLAYVKEKYLQMFPGNPFDYFFLDTFFERQYKNDRQFGQVFAFFAMLAIFVASLGLFGLASFMATQRTKEIGIRKVLGSSVAAIFLLLSKDFLKLVLIANAFAIPVVWWLMDAWLKTFAFRIHIGLGIFGLAAIITALVALITISYQSLSAAIANPVKALRYE